MSGALPILVAQGQENVHLTSNPEISFFRTNFRRHVNFSQAVLSQVVTGNPQPGSVSTVTFTKKGDLLNYVYITKKVGGVLQADITAQDIEKVEFMIGGQVIDTLTTDQAVSLRNFSSRYPQTFRGTEEGGVLGFYGMYHYPMNFFFCENWQCSIPLIALQYHNVELRITWGAGASPSTIYELWANYIYLDNGERGFMVDQKSRDMIIYQHQESRSPTDLNFSNPVSFIFSKSGTTDIFGKSQPNVTDTLKFQINGVDIVSQKEVTPHYNIIPTMYHTSNGRWSQDDPISNVAVTYNGAGTLVADVTVTTQLGTNSNFVFPFCLDCSKLQPNGSCNFSRIDSAKFVTSSIITKPMYARNFNILRIEDGMGGLLYAV